MDKGFQILAAMQEQIIASEDRGLETEFDLLPDAPDPSVALVAGYIRVLNEWGQTLTTLAHQQFEGQDYANYKVTSDVLSRVTSWWMYANQSLVQSIDNAKDVATATRLIQQATTDLSAAATKFQHDTSALTDVSKILDGLFDAFKTVIK